MSFETFRDINTFLPLLATFWLAYRTSKEWPAEWAKPDHVTHYRTLLVLLGSATTIVCAGSIYHEAMHSQATWVSPAWTVFSLGVLTLCALWPKPRSMRREP